MIKQLGISKRMVIKRQEEFQRRMPDRETSENPLSFNAVTYLGRFSQKLTGDLFFLD